MQSFFVRAAAPLAAATLLTFGHAEAVLAGEGCPGPEEIVRAHAAALTRADSRQLLLLFNEDAHVFSVPRDPERLVGELSPLLGTHDQRRIAYAGLSRSGLAGATEVMAGATVMETVAVHDLVIAELRLVDASEPARVTHALTAFRIADCRIADVWNIAQTSQHDPAGEDRAQAVIRELVVANNAGQVERFLDAFAPGVLHYRSSGDQHAIGDRPSKYNGDAQGRRQVYLRMFANGAPAQVEVLGMITVGDLVVSRDVATLPDGRVLDEISIYRIAGDRITHDWFVSERERGK